MPSLTETKKALILLAGGIDSTTCLAIAQSEGFDCYALSFDYGQKHCYELNAAKRVAAHFGVIEHKIIDLSVLGHLGGSSLTDDKLYVPDYQGDGQIPSTYVPARNTIFLAIALGWAEVLGAQAIFYGANVIDYSGYPDCRPEYVDAFQKLADLATKVGVEGKSIKVEAPLLYLSKAQTIQLGISLGVDYSMTVSCYRTNNLGYACGTCDSCHLRKQGFLQASIPDPTLY